jgi:transcription elongation factor Elf1
MEDYPKTMLELEERFRSEEDCRDYLAKLRWPEGFRCPRCGHDKAWSKSNGLRDCQRCGLQTSPLAGTIFQDTKKPLGLWFRAMWHVTSQKYGANALGIQRILLMKRLSAANELENVDVGWRAKHWS